MKATTVVMLVASIWFIVFGILILASKGFKEKMVLSIKNAKDKEGYIRFNALYNIIIGILGIIIGIANQVVTKDNITLIIFIVVMLGASIIQGNMGKKYR
ncbi:hypothetical protein KQI89_11855 [Clostridium sp. MSJ-4]|uniref:DUF3784 domain-containing protein n=1 Tax=Clostridium simiarum TaxID=2841506 RepID=A0ABS6F244_9CLOT|nr:MULTISPECIES: hypothetical protein [Clostridium]MBU5592450.1 hypothetical protein [Clostridium simiarum]